MLTCRVALLNGGKKGHILVNWWLGDKKSVKSPFYE